MPENQCLLKLLANVSCYLCSSNTRITSWTPAIHHKDHEEITPIHQLYSIYTAIHTPHLMLYSLSFLQFSSIFFFSFFILYFFSVFLTFNFNSNLIILIFLPLFQTPILMHQLSFHQNCSLINSFKLS